MRVRRGGTAPRARARWGGTSSGQHRRLLGGTSTGREFFLLREFRRRGRPHGLRRSPAAAQQLPPPPLPPPALLRPPPPRRRRVRVRLLRRVRGETGRTSKLACRRGHTACVKLSLPNLLTTNRSRAHVGLNVWHDREAPVLLHEVAIGWLEEAVHHSKVEGRAGATGLLALVRDALRPIGLRGHSDSRSFGDHRLGPCRAPQTLTRKGDVRRVTWPPRT